MGAESERVAQFGRLEDGLLQAGEWYRWGVPGGPGGPGGGRCLGH